MPFITLDTAKAHLRIDGTDSDVDLAGKIATAEELAIDDLNCNVYADQNALDTAIAAVPATLAAAKAAYDIAYSSAIAITDADLSLIEEAHALAVYMRAVYAATATRNGVVITARIISAMLIIVGYLYENREGEEKVPEAAQRLLDKSRCYA